MMGTTDIVTFLSGRLDEEQDAWGTHESVATGIQASRTILDMYEECEAMVTPTADEEEDFYSGVRTGLFLAVVALANRFATHPVFDSDWDMSRMYGSSFRQGPQA
jgi:hypothetical protein